jgi:4-hydroxy-4-methyl-2-oxoglutarate aldolase
MVVADEEGVVVVPHELLEEVLEQALAKAAKDAGQSLDEWDAEHRERIDAILADG